jgi:hypothetical protein
MDSEIASAAMISVKRLRMSIKDRERRRRDRRKRGIVLGIEVEELALEVALARARFISPDEAASREALAAALTRVVRIWVRETTRGLCSNHSP